MPPFNSSPSSSSNQGPQSKVEKEKFDIATFDPVKYEKIEDMPEEARGYFMPVPKHEGGGIRANKKVEQMKLLKGESLRTIEGALDDHGFNINLPEAIFLNSFLKGMEEHFIGSIEEQEVLKTLRDDSNQDSFLNKKILSTFSSEEFVVFKNKLIDFSSLEKEKNKEQKLYLKVLSILKEKGATDSNDLEACSSRLQGLHENTSRLRSDILSSDIYKEAVKQTRIHANLDFLGRICPSGIHADYMNDHDNEVGVTYVDAIVDRGESSIVEVISPIISDWISLGGNVDEGFGSLQKKDTVEDFFNYIKSIIDYRNLKRNDSRGTYLDTLHPEVSFDGKVFTYSTASGINEIGGSIEGYVWYKKNVSGSIRPSQQVASTFLKLLHLQSVKGLLTGDYKDASNSLATKGIVL